MSLRKQKAARLKILILNAALALVEKKSFQDLHVDDLCRKVKISKVTLFKYFPQKDDLLLYYFRIWCLRRAVDMRQKPKSGLPGIYYLFDKVCDDLQQHPGVWLGLLAYLADFRRMPKPFPVKAEEKALLFPDVPGSEGIEAVGLDQWIEKFVLEAIFRKEITKTTATREMAQLIHSVLFGSVLTAHVQQISAPKIFFRKSLDMTVRGLAH
jgi:AcrR family transcriptional regulator